MIFTTFWSKEAAKSSKLQGVDGRWVESRKTEAILKVAGHPMSRARVCVSFSGHLGYCPKFSW